MQIRSFQISAIVLILFSIICSRIPLFNYLGFEFSALTVLLAGYISGILTIGLWNQTVPEFKSDVWRYIGRCAAASFVLLVIPFLLLLANAVLVKNCSLGDGAKLYTLTVVPGVFFSISLAVFIGMGFKKLRKTFFTVTYILVLLHIPFVTLFRPQVFAFNPILGFFPGFTYDESLQVMQRLFTYRLATLAADGCIVSVSVWLWHVRKYKKAGDPSAGFQIPLIELMAVALLAPAVVIVFAMSDRLGFSSSENFIRQKLAGNFKTTHFEIIYSAGSVTHDRIEQIGMLHEFYFEKLSHELNVQFREPITSFLYASPEQKGRLIGAAHTDLTKPWLSQVHINLADVESALCHELVHVLSAEFGWSPLKIAPNSGLIEGLAVAMEPSSFIEEPPDHAAAMVFASGGYLRLESLFSFTGFVQANPLISYTLAGSFCRFLIDMYGIDPFKHLYRTGNFKDSYQQDLSALLAAWQASIKKIPLEDADMIKAKYFFRRPSIFGKECARVIANMNSETREYFIQHDFEKALQSAEQSSNLSKTPEAVSQKAAALFEMRRFKEYIGYVRGQLRDSAIGYALLPLHFRLGDAYWAMDSMANAKEEYEWMSRIRLNASNIEACLIRLEAIKNTMERGELQIYFTYSMDDTARVARLERLRSPIARYVLAREMAVKGHFGESARILESVGPMDQKPLEFFRLFRLGKDWFEMKEFDKAMTVFSQSRPLVPDSSLQIETTEWIERCKFCIRYSYGLSMNSLNETMRRE